MDIDIIFRIAAIGIIISIINQILKHSNKDELAMLTSLAGLIIVLMMIIPQLGVLFETVKNTFGLY